MARKYPAVFALSAVIAGIAIADTLDIASWIFLFAAVTLFIFVIAFYTGNKRLLAGILGLVGLISLSAFSYTFRFKTYPPGHIIHYVDDDRKYTIFGTIDDWPVIRNQRTDVTITVDSVVFDGKVRRGMGRLLVNLQTETTSLQYGDRIYFDSRLYSIKGGRNPSGFDYRRYLNLKGVFAVSYLPHQFALQIDPVGRGHFYQLVRSLRNYITDAFKKTLDTNAAALASGFLIGDTRDIPPDVYDLFRDSGTLHLLAVSGSNVGLVVILFSFLLKASPLKTTGRTALLLMIIVVFSFLAYNQPSVVRAAIMASLVLIGRALQRKVDLNNIIASTALIILIFKPTELFDVGFQLSFVTAWGLILFVPRVNRALKIERTKPFYRIFLFTLIVCIVAQLVSLPMCAYYFQRMPMVSFVSNLMIVPLVALIVIGEMILLLTYLLLPLAGHFIGSILNPFIGITLSLLRLFGSDELNMLINYQVTGISLLLYYVFLIVLSFAIYSKVARRAIVLYLLLIANGLMIATTLGRDAKPRFTIFSVPGGIISVNQLNEPQVVLSDLPRRDYLIAEKTIEPYLLNRGINKCDIVALSSDYQTLKEASYLSKLNRSSKVFLPISSRNLFMDICDLDSTSLDTSLIIYYEESPIPGNWSDHDVILSDGLILYNFDSSIVAFMSNDSRFEVFSAQPEMADKGLVVIKSLISQDDIASFAQDGSISAQFVVCNRIAKRAKRLLDSQKAKSDNIMLILQTSQVGAIDLVIEGGRVLPKD